MVRQSFRWNPLIVGVLGLSMLATVGVSSTHAQVTLLFGSPTPRSWFDYGSWVTFGVFTPSFPPTEDDTGIINQFGGFVAKCELSAGSSPATAWELIIGSSGRGELNHVSGALEVGDRLTLGLSSGLGEYGILDGSLLADSIVLGQSNAYGDSGAGIFDMSGGSTVTSRRIIVGNGASSFYGNTFRQSGSAMNTVTGDLELGLLGPGTYENQGGWNKVHDLYVSAGAHAGVDGTVSAAVASSTYLITHSGSAPSGVLEVEHQAHIGGGVPLPGMFGTLNNDSGTISGLDPAAEAIVHTETGRMIGDGTYDIRVTFTDDDGLNLSFGKGTLTRSAVLAITPALTPGNTGAGEINATLAGRMLPGTARNIHWGGAPGPTDVQYSTAMADRPTIALRYAAGSVVGIAGVAAANIESRIRMLQFGQDMVATNGSVTTGAGPKGGEIRNITDPAGPITGIVRSGLSQNVGGDFDAALLGTAVLPKHQNPQIQVLHARASPLTGDGVLIGQIEPGLPYLAHGCFDDWSQPDPAVRRAFILGAPPAAGASTGHSTFVASLMVGYDPLGVQVDGQSQFEPAANRYNGGFGFVGVAPRARLYSIDSRSAAFDVAFATLAGVTEGAGGTLNRMKIINMSAGSASGAATGHDFEERVVDYHVETSGIVFVKSAGNDGQAAGGGVAYGSLTVPGGSYNGITVGNAEFDLSTGSSAYPQNFDAAHASVEPSSSRGPTNEAGTGRSKPDLVAQGTGGLGAFTMEEFDTRSATAAAWTTINDAAYPEDGNRGLYSTRSRNGPVARRATAVADPAPNTYTIPADSPNTGTSFAAPTVAGVAALMVERARKPDLFDVERRAEDPRVIKSVLMTTADKPGGWEKGQAGVAADNTTMVPLSYDWGAGLLDPVQAVDLLGNGRHPIGVHATSEGWDLDTIRPIDASPVTGLSGDVYFLDGVVGARPLIATLNWYRHVHAAGESFTEDPLVNLNLFLYSWDGSVPTLIESSNSIVDNLEHIYVDHLPSDGNYLLRVVGSDYAGRDSESYALSWDYTPKAVPEPGTLLLLFAGMAAGLGLWSRRKWTAVFIVGSACHGRQ
jgi:hypothetical protein